MVFSFIIYATPQNYLSLRHLAQQPTPSVVQVHWTDAQLTENPTLAAIPTGLMHVSMLMRSPSVLCSREFRYISNSVAYTPF